MPEQKSDTNPLDQVDPDFLAELRTQMLKFAVLQLSDPVQAEDAVQEALLGALKNAASFGRRSALKTWVFAILKHKIIDTLRQRNRQLNASSLSDNPLDESDPFEQLFDEKGFWHQDERPVKWQHPDTELENDQFWQVFDACLNRLPDTQGRIFMMREFLDLDSGEICDAEGLTLSNLHVLLYRARLRLRECLENRWFLEGEQR